MAIEPIVLQLQSDCLSTAVPIPILLRKAKLIGSKLELTDFEAWLESELNGYKCSNADLPDYRKGLGAPKMFNPYHGWQNIVLADSQLDRLISACCFHNAISEIEHMLSTSDSGFVIIGFHEPIRDFLHKELNIQLQCGLYVSTSVLAGILEGVKTSVLDWTLKLEKNGIVGEGMSFSKIEIERAQTVNNSFYNSNIGVVGAVSGDANNSHFFTKTGDVNQQALLDIVSKIKDASPGLPSDIAFAIEPSVNQLEQGAHSRDETVISSAISVIKKVLEGAGGNLVATAILSAISAAS